MRKILSNVALVMVAFLSITATSCLKDEGYENGEYGSITGRTEGQEFVSIPAASRPKNILTVGVEAKSGSQPVKVFALSYDAADPVSADFTATMAVDNSLVTAADPTVVILPSNAYTVQSLTLNFRSGKRFSDSLVVNINTDLLDPTKKYGLGLTLASVSKAGVQIPSNLKNVVLVFTIKNKYDGIYNIRAHMLHPVDRDPNWLRTPFNYAYEIHLVTTGPRTVEWINTAFGTEGYHPLHTPAVSGFGATRPGFEFDANDKLIAVWNAFPNPANGRAFVINNATTWTINGVDVTINNRYDPVAKKIYAAFFMTQPGFQPIPIFDTLTFNRPRP